MLPLSLTERRFLSQESPADAAACDQAFAESGGDLIGALKLLRPDYVGSDYHDVYHFGDFLPVEDPDKDLPRRKGTSPSDDEILRITDMDGQRCIPPFRDGNALSDILGGLYTAARYPKWQDWQRFDSRTIQGCLLVASDRIRDKLRRNRNPERAEGFTAALRAVRAAADHHFNAEYQAGEALIWEAVHALQAGNRRRKRASGSQ